MGIDVNSLPKGSALRNRIEETLAKERSGGADKIIRIEPKESLYRSEAYAKPVNFMKLRKVFLVDPVHAPRQTRKDAWDPRPCVLKYRAFRDEINEQLGDFRLPDANFWIRFLIPVFPSYSPKKKKALIGTHHKNKPDRDNLEKAFIDAIFRDLPEDDKIIADGRTTKIWVAEGEGRIEVFF